MKRSDTLMMGLVLGCFLVTTALAGTQARQETHKPSGVFRVNTLYSMIKFFVLDGLLR